MTLGEKIRKARLERHLTQKQLAGSMITRNMLSQIESGSAQPSVKTLEYLASVLELPAGYFITEEAGSGLIPEVLQNARGLFRTGQYQACIEALADAEAGGCEDECQLLLARAQLALAQRMAEQGSWKEAESLARQALEANAATIYRSDALCVEAELLLLRAAMACGGEIQREMDACNAACQQLSLYEDYLLTCAEAALYREEPEVASETLERLQRLPESKRSRYFMLQGRTALQRQDYSSAAEWLSHAERELGQANTVHSALLSEVYAGLETCWRELEDYRRAYRYAALQLELQKKSADNP